MYLFTVQLIEVPSDFTVIHAIAQKQCKVACKKRLTNMRTHIISVLCFLYSRCSSKKYLIYCLATAKRHIVE